MDRSQVINLIAVTVTQDEIQQNVERETARTVYCNISSIDGNEFLRAGQLGIKARYRITMFKYDYQGEQIVELNGDRYSVYRTYEGRNDMIDLYIEQKAGVSNG